MSRESFSSDDMQAKPFNILPQPKEMLWLALLPLLLSSGPVDTQGPGCELRPAPRPQLCIDILSG